MDGLSPQTCGIAPRTSPTIFGLARFAWIPPSLWPLTPSSFAYRGRYHSSSLAHPMVIVAHRSWKMACRPGFPGAPVAADVLPALLPIGGIACGIALRSTSQSGRYCSRLPSNMGHRIPEARAASSLAAASSRFSNLSLTTPMTTRLAEHTSTLFEAGVNGDSSSQNLVRNWLSCSSERAQT